MKEPYDLVFGMGYACSCALALRAAKLQFESFPFDWNTCQDPKDLLVRANLIRTDFAHWLDKEDLSFFSHNLERESMDVYTNRRTRFVLIHDFEKGLPFETAYRRVCEKYGRRIARLSDRISSSRRVLVVRLDSPAQPAPTEVADCRATLQILQERFPNTTFDLLLVSLDKSRAFKSRLAEDLGGHLTRISFDYRSKAPNAPDYQTDSDQLSAVLRSVASARDYRTREQRAAFRRKKQLDRWAEFGATNRWQYLLAKLRHRLHL